MSHSSNRPPRAGLPIWWVVSILFHALLLTWLIFFSPVKVIDLSKKSPTANVSPGRAREIMSKISEKQAENLAADVKDLQDMKQQLARLEAAKRDEFEKFSREAVKNAPEQIERDQAAATQAQLEALAAQARADTVISNALRTRAESDLNQLDALQKEAAAAQARVIEAQRRSLENLAVSDQRFSGAYQAQAEAKAAQERAANAQSAARVVQDKKAKDDSDKIASLSNSVAQAQKDFAGTTAQLLELTNSLATLRETAAKTDTNTAPGLKSFTQAQGKIKSVGEKINHIKSQNEKYAGRIADYGARLKAAQAEAGGVPAAASNEQLVKLQTEAQQRQREAQSAQAQARERFAAAKQLSAPATAGMAALPQPVEPPSASNPPETLAKMDLPKLYDTALKTEEELTESYRRLRATELAMIRQIPIARALEYTDSVKVNRPDLQSALTNSANVDSAREAIQNARSEIKAIHSLGSSLLAQARDLDRSGSRSAAGAPIAPGAGANTAVANRQNLEALAAEDENARAKDLTLAMKRSGSSVKSGSGGGGKSKSGAGAGGSGKAGSGPGSSSGAGGSGGGTGSGGGAGDAGSTGGGTAVGGGGAGNGGGGAGGSGASSGFGDGVGGGSTVPTGVGSDISAMPGRTVAARGESARWMFVDSWYILGPFDNPGRANIDKQFPPETVVDRSAVYNGKGGAALQWEFHQAHEPKIVPPFRSYNAGSKRDLQYIIYYAATELYFEEECDLWVAIGSDDYSKVWINDQLVWASGKGSKSWRVDEGLRKVHFEKGVNRVLYRVENGHGPTEFSLVIGMP